MQISTETDLMDAIEGANGPLRIKGGGTRSLGSEGGEVDVSGLRGVRLYEPGALTMVAAAGTPVAEIEVMLAEQGQRLAFEPYFVRKGPSTIGGVMASNASGPRRIQGGAARDHLLGVRFVDGSGQVISNGGRVMKNVTGYDLVKLMAGSRGTLGVLSEVSFKVLPMPETAATLRLTGLSPEDAVAAMSAALGSPYDVSGAAHQGAETLLRVEGFEASVRYRLDALRARLSQFGDGEALDAQATETIWADIRDAAALSGLAYLARVSIRPSDLGHLMAQMKAMTPQCDAEIVLDWGGGLVWVGTDTGELEAVAGLHAGLQAFCGARGGHATLVRAPDGLLGRIPVVQPEPAGLAALSAGLRAKFDPRGLFQGALAPAVAV